MKRITKNLGGQKWSSAELELLQKEPLTVLDAYFREYGACIIEGCNISPAGSLYNLSPGIVALQGKDVEGADTFKVVPFAGVEGVSLPVYLTLACEVVERPYADGLVKPIAYNYTAAASAVQPGNPFLEITADGGRRFADAIKITEKLDKIGNGKDLKVTFSEATSRVNVNSGERLSVLFGKVRRWFTDLRALAFKDQVAKSDLEAGLQAEIDGKLPKGEIVKVYKSLEANHAYVRSEDATANVAKMYIGTCYGYNTPVDAMEVMNGNVNALGELSVKDNTVWHAGNDGSGSGLDADTVDGLHAAPAGTVVAGKLASYDNDGYFRANIFKDTFSVNNIDPINEICFRISQSDGYHRFCGLSRLKEALSVGNQIIAGNMILNTASESFVQFKRNNVIKGSIGLASGSNTNMYLSNDTGNSSLCLTDNGKCLANGKEIATTDMIPTSLPASGGNADTVDGKHAAEFLGNSGNQTIDGDLSLNTLSQSCVKFFRNGVYKAYVGCGDMGTTDVYLYNVVSNAHVRAADNGKCYANGKEIATIDQLDGDQGGVGDRDWNTIVTPGNYLVSATGWGTNGPSEVYQYGVLTVATAGTAVTQTYCESNEGTIYYRVRYNESGGFGAWITIAKKSAIPKTTADLPDSANKRYVTDAEKEKMTNSLKVICAGVVEASGRILRSVGSFRSIKDVSRVIITHNWNQSNNYIIMAMDNVGKRPTIDIFNDSAFEIQFVSSAMITSFVMYEI